MKNKLMGALLATSMFVAVPAFAEDATPPVDSGWGISSVLSSVVNAPGDLHGSYPKVTGVAALAIVAIIAYKMGAAEAEENPTRDGDLI